MARARTSGSEKLSPIAIDRKALITGVVSVWAGPPVDHIRPITLAHNPNLKPLAYNPELSKKLLAQAGYKNGLNIKGYLTNTARPTTLAEAVKNMLAKVGITWKGGMKRPGGHC